MSKFYYLSDTLKSSLAQKLVSHLQSLRSWKDVMGGIGGVILSEKSISRVKLSADKLQAITIPNAAKFELHGESIIDGNNSHCIPDPIGSSFRLPKDIGSLLMCVRTYQGKKLVTHFNYESSSSLYHQASFANKYPKRSKPSIELHTILLSKKLNSYGASKKWLETVDGQIGMLRDEIEYFMDFCRNTGLPLLPYNCDVSPHGPTPSALPEGVPTGVEHCYFTCTPEGDSLNLFIRFDPMILPDWTDMLKKYQNWLIKNSQPYEISSSVNYGGMNWFGGAVGCVTEEANELIQRECAKPQYDSYDVSYMKLSPESWDHREKRRKKLLNPAFQMLGECELDNGCKLTLRLKMLKEGYVVILDFPTDDDMIRFAETELFRKTKWQSSAE